MHRSVSGFQCNVQFLLTVAAAASFWFDDELGLRRLPVLYMAELSFNEEYYAFENVLRIGKTF